MSAIPATVTQGWSRSRGPQESAASLICIQGDGGVGKTRLAACAARACPEWFGERMVYIPIDPEAGSLASVLPEDLDCLEVATLDFSKNIEAQLLSIYRFNWRAEGFKTIITDTMSVASQFIFADVTNSGKFTDKHIDLGNGIKIPQPGDYQATNNIVNYLLRAQHQSRYNHLTLFHDQEVRPEPGQPGEPIGGPATVGKASIRSIINWYNTALHVVKRQKKRTDITKPVEYERVVHTAGHGIWQAKLKSGEKNNPVPEIIMEPDPVNVWKTINNVLKKGRE